mmetsp:Transcript_6357/g.14900  ORF Transcript_6357/g.14900 Transcript_6357/m.14900 type:complete len:160 (-) Transcript_6357:136-615(-)
MTSSYRHAARRSSRLTWRWRSPRAATAASVKGGAIPCAPPRRAAPCAPPRRPAAHHNLLCRGLRSHASCLSWCAAPRSGLAWKNFIDTGAGVIDADYRGNVGVILFNHSEDDFQVKVGDRVAQLVLERIYTPEVKEVDSLEDTARGEGGFGSTGVSESK